MAEQTFPPATDRCAVVTGSNKGIGLEICRQLAAKGIRVILTARDEKKGREAVAHLNNSNVVFHQLDVQDSSSIASLAKFIQTQFGKLDILVNNAGVSGAIFDSDLSDADDLMKTARQSYENAIECLDTNYYGLKRVTEALIPLLKLSDSGNIVNVSAGLGKLKWISNESIKQELRDLDGVTEERIDEILQKFLKDFKEDELEINGWPCSVSAYTVSKVAVNAYTRILAKKFPSLLVNCVCPGYVKTDLNNNKGILTVEEGAKAPVMLATLPVGSPSGLIYDRMEITTAD